MAQIGFYAGPGGIGVGVGAPGPYYGYGGCGYYNCGGYYNYYGGPNVVAGGGWHGHPHFHHGFHHRYSIVASACLMAIGLLRDEQAV